MKLLSITLLLLLTSCSGGDSTGKVTSSKSLSEVQLQAKALINESIAPLREGQYQIDAEDIELLVQDGTITDEEYKSLIIVQ